MRSKYVIQQAYIFIKIFVKSNVSMDSAIGYHRTKM